MPKRRSPLESAVDRAARMLRQVAMSAAEGAFLGCEETLMSELMVSRATLRQAATLIAQENLVSIRRGRRGGYFAHRPDTSGVTRIAAIYLQSKQVQTDELVEAVAPIRLELVRLAASNISLSKRSLLDAFLDQDQSVVTMSHLDFLNSERSLGRILGEISENKLLTLFLDVIYDVAGRMPRINEAYRWNSVRIAAYRAQRRRLTYAILEGDVELAETISRTCSSLMSGWLSTDFLEQPTRSSLVEIVPQTSSLEIPPPSAHRRNSRPAVNLQPEKYDE